MAERDWDNGKNILGYARMRGKAALTLHRRVATRDGAACRTCGQTGTGVILHSGHIVPFKLNGLYGLNLTVNGRTTMTSGLVVPTFSPATFESQDATRTDLMAVGFSEVIATAIAFDYPLDRTVWLASNVRPMLVGNAWHYCASLDWNVVQMQCEQCNLGNGMWPMSHHDALSAIRYARTASMRYHATWTAQ